MVTGVSTAPRQDRTRLLLVDTDNLFMHDLGATLRGNEDVEVVGTAGRIGDAYECAFKYRPDVIVIGWGVEARRFAHAAVETPFSPQGKPLVVIVLPEDTVRIPGLKSLSLMPNVVVVLHAQLERLLCRHAALAGSVQIH